MTETFEEFCKNILIVMTTYNRKSVTELCLKNMEETKNTATLWIVDDHSTEYSLEELQRFAPSAIVKRYDKKLGIEKLRMKIQSEALTTGFKYIYHTDNDAYHDPIWLSKIYEIRQKHKKLIGLFNSKFHVNNFSMRHGNQLAKMTNLEKEATFRLACPGISFFFEQSLIKNIPTSLKNSWDFELGDQLLPAAISNVSYVEHFGAGGIHNTTFETDRALNPSQWLIKKRSEILNSIRTGDLSTNSKIKLPCIKCEIPLDLPKFPIDAEIVYDMGLDRIGDSISALSVLEYYQKLNPKLKISIAYYARNYEEYSWTKGIELLDWSTWKPHRVYRSLDEVPSSAIVFDSNKYFSVLHTMKYLNVYPKLKNPKDIQPSEFNVTFHLINVVGARSNEYVSRRALNIEKYEKLALHLCDLGIPVTRLGASYDSVRQLDPRINDLTSKDLSLHDTYDILSKSSLHIGGDTGLTHAAAAFGIPLLIEADNVSKSDGGLNGIPSNLLNEVEYNCDFETHLKALEKMIEKA